MKINRQVIQSVVSFLCILLLLAPITVQAQTKVVVIPLFGDDSKPLKNIITVAKANGDFTDPVAAVKSIKDASADNPYLVVIGPGVYTITQTLQMQEYVDIAGSGENVTKITGAISTESPDGSSAIISGVTNATLSSLAVENTGGGGYSIGLYNYNASPRVSHATLTASGGTHNRGVYNYSSSPTLSNVSVTASGGSLNHGVHNTSSSPTLSNVSITASGGTESYGVCNDRSSPTMNNATVTASGAVPNNRGVHNSYSYPAIRRSTIEAGDWALSAHHGTVLVSQSTVIGSVSGGTDIKCVACDDGSGKALDGNCKPIP